MDRKYIIASLQSRYLESNVKTRYLGVPSFNYEMDINNVTYTIDRDGKIFKPSGEEIKFDELMEVHNLIDEKPRLELTVSMEGHTGKTLRNLINIIYSKQVLIKKVFDVEKDIIHKDFIITINAEEINTIEDFMDKLKRELVPGIVFEDNIITFKFIKDFKPEQIKAYSTFVTSLNEFSKKIKYASYKPTNTDNEKFTMRVFLIRLGLIGQQFKESRKELLKNLDGNSAYRNFNNMTND